MLLVFLASPREVLKATYATGMSNCIYVLLMSVVRVFLRCLESGIFLHNLLSRGRVREDFDDLLVHDNILVNPVARRILRGEGISSAGSLRNGAVLRSSRAP